MSNYEPGTVAVATVRGVPNVRVMRTDENGTPFAWCAADPCDDAVWATAAEVTDVRPLVVLDLDSSPFLDEGAGIGAVIIHILRDNYDGACAQWLADQIEAQARPPKPEEPAGLGAVVEDAEGTSWIRNATHDDCKWRSGYGSWRTYADIDAVRILSAGVDQ